MLLPRSELGDKGLPAVAAAIRSVAPSADPPSATDELLDAAALLVDAGYAVGAPAAQRAVRAFCATPICRLGTVRRRPYRCSAYVEEQDRIQEAIGGDSSPGSRIILAAYHGHEAEVARRSQSGPASSWRRPARKYASARRRRATI